MEVTREKLTEALTGLYLEVLDGDRIGYGSVRNPGPLAGQLWARLDGVGEPDEAGVAHVCCEHAPEDRELRLMVHVSREIDEMSDRAAGRFTAWVTDRYPPE